MPLYSARRRLGDSNNQCADSMLKKPSYKQLRAFLWYFPRLAGIEPSCIDEQH